MTAQFPCRWDEILEFRRCHVGSPEQATRTLLYQKNQLHFHQPGGSHVPPGYYPYAPYAPYSNGGGASAMYHQGYIPPAGVPTGKLIDITAAAAAVSNPPMPIHHHQNGNGIKKNGHHHDQIDHAGSSASSTSTLTGTRGPIPLTIKTLEAENRRKTLLAEAAAAAANANDAKNPLESWDYVYRQLESIGYTKDQGERPDVLDILSKVGMNPQHRKQLEQRLREQQMGQPHPQSSSSPEPPPPPKPPSKNSRR